MCKVSWMTLFSISLLLPAVSLADNVTSSDPADEPMEVVTTSVEQLLAEMHNASRWRLIPPTEPLTYSYNWSHPIADFDFKDPSALARVSKLRSLSLLTLAEFGPTRFFLGVNDDGFVGLHFNVFPRLDEEDYLEVVRMPYLKDKDPHSEVAQLSPELN